MTTLALIRHGVTAWNAEGRIQGRVDTPLSPEGVAELRALRPPASLDGAAWLTSPLRRARQTAALLGQPAMEDARLIETAWGAWEGLRREATLGCEARLAARGFGGLDLRPPSGESPRDVQMRLTGLFADLAGRGGAWVGVTHKGVIRAALALATGWDMTRKPDIRLTWRAAHLFRLAPDGTARLIEANIPFAPREGVGP